MRRHRPIIMRLRTASILLPALLFATAAAAATRTWSFTATDPERPGRDVPLVAIAPAVAPAPCPVAVIGHATMMPWERYRYLADPLAEAGWLVLLPDTENGMIADQAALAADMLLAAELALTGSAQLPADLPAAGDRWAVLGHSLGGGAAVLAAAVGDPASVVLLAPQERARPSMIAHADQVTAPTLLLAGELDCITPPAVHQDPLHAALAALPRAYAVLLGGGHCSFATPCEPCLGAEDGCPPELSTEEQQQRTLGLAMPWLEWTVRGATAAHHEFLAAAAAAALDTDLVGLATAAPNATGRASLELLGPSVGSGVVRWRLAAPSAALARAEVFDVRGRRIRRLAAPGDPTAGILRWDGRDDAGQRVPAGVYLLRVTAGRDVLRSHVVRVE